MSKVFLSQLQKNNGEACVELPSELMNSLKWDIGDVIGFKNLVTGGIHILNLTKRKNLPTKEISENDWACTNQGEFAGDGYLDQSISGQEEEYEEEIDLYTTYGGD